MSNRGLIYFAALPKEPDRIVIVDKRRDEEVPQRAIDDKLYTTFISEDWLKKLSRYDREQLCRHLNRIFELGRQDKAQEVCAVIGAKHHSARW